MTVEEFYYQDELDQRNLHDKCKRYMYHHVMMTMNDGSTFDGIIEDVNENGMTVLVGEDATEREDLEEDRQFYGYGYDYNYGRPRRRFRRFRRRFFPIAALAALALLPYVYPYPYPYYPPYYPYY
ncbi:hypothetical protein [uncultured Metabacillus sp.]|uniref:hypothetical protein n=1 Tax=uncultured Metabacillus sp. TaxID=2860135 RepID=UPI002612839A|nr:hypothetical protein [uncultured Metabacillus sp.]